jgi:RHS repeat-associated protein
MRSLIVRGIPGAEGEDSTKPRVSPQSGIARQHDVARPPGQRFRHMRYTARPPGHWVRHFLTLASIWLVALAATPRRAAAQCSNTSISVSPCNTSMTELANTSNVRVVFTWTNLLAVQQQVDPTVSCTGYVVSCTFTTAFVHMAAHASGTDTVVFSTGNGTSGSFKVSGNGVSSTITVSAPTHVAPVVSLPYYNNDNVQASLCASHCFDKVLMYTTPAYYTMDTPRSVTLMYRSNTANPMVTVQVDATDNSSTPPTKMSLKVQRTNTTGSPLATFTNGSTELYFTFSDSINPNRLAGQFAPQGADTLTGAYSYTVIVTSYFADATTLSASTPLRILLENERWSLLGAGWTFARMQHGYIQSDSSLVITDGAGSISYFQISVPGCSGACSYSSPTGDHTTLTSRASVGADSIRYDRRYPDSTIVSFRRDGRLKSVTDARGNSTGYYYDSQLRLTGILDPLQVNNSWITPLYNDSVNSRRQGTLRVIFDSFGRTARFSVNANNDLYSIQDPAKTGSDATFAPTYNAQHQLTSYLDRAQDRWAVAYDFAGKILADSSPAVLVNGATQPVVKSYQSAERTFLINPSSGQGSSTNPAPFEGGGPWWAAVTDPNGNATNFTLDRWEQPLQINDPAGGTTVFGRGGTAYTAGGIPALSITYPWGGTDQARYNAQGLLSWSKPAGGDSTTYLYRNNYAIPDSVFGPNQPTISRNVFHGRIESVTIGGATTTYNYLDSRNRLTEIIDPLFHHTYLYYDATFGNQDSTLASSNRFTKRTFDTYGRSFSVKANGVPAQYTWYDLLNRVVKTYGGTQLDTTRYSYDSVYLRRVQDAKGQVYRWTNNALGWRTQQFDPADTINLSQSYAYDKNGNVTRYTNRRGQVVNTTYDALGRYLSVTGTGVMTRSFTYSANQRVTVAADAVAIDTVYADTTGIITTNATTFLTNGSSGPQFRKNYYTNTIGQLDSETVTTTSGITFPSRHLTWNAARGLLSTIQVAGQTLTFTFDPDGMLGGIDYGAVGFVNGNLANYRVASTQFYDDPHGGTDSLLNRWFSRDYYYDSVGRALQVTAPLGSLAQTFTYDSIGHFASETDYSIPGCAAIDTTFGYNCASGPHSSPVAYQYDAVGNLTAVNGGSWTYGAGNRLQSEGGATFTMDADGNVTRRTDIAHDMRFGWSPDGLLVSDTVHGTAAVVAYDYDALGRLARRTTNGTVDRYYLWNGGQLLAELDGTAQHRIGEYVYAGTDQPVALLTGSTTVTATRFMVQDVLNNVSGVFQPGTISQYFTFSPFGRALLTTGSLGDTNRLRWRGLMWQGDSTQLYYMRSRWYDPTTGRFMSQDAIGLAGGINPYVFAGADYINGNDPLGECADGDAQIGGDPSTSALGTDGQYYHLCVGGDPLDSTFHIYSELDGSDISTGPLTGAASDPFISVTGDPYQVSAFASFNIGIFTYTLNGPLNSNPVQPTLAMRLPPQIGYSAGVRVCPQSGCGPTLNFSGNALGSPFGVGVPIDGTEGVILSRGANFPPWPVTVTIPMSGINACLRSSNIWVAFGCTGAGGF